MRKIAGLVIFLVVSSISYAHYLWLNVDNYTPKPGEEITISVGWGHKFPVDAEPKANTLDKLYLVDPKGKTIPLEIKAKGERGVEPVKVKLKEKGTYLAVLTKKSGFVCKTTKGYFYKSKKELTGVISSSWSEGSAFAIINVGSPEGEAFQKEIGQRFQVVALEDPGKLRKGEHLPLKIVLKDRPEGTHAGFVYATYIGFSDGKGTFCYTGKPDRDGVIKIKLLERGIWLIYAPEKIPYPNTDEADVYSFTSTLTFEVK